MGRPPAEPEQLRAPRGIDALRPVAGGREELLNVDVGGAAARIEVRGEVVEAFGSPRDEFPKRGIQNVGPVRVAPEGRQGEGEGSRELRLETSPIGVGRDEFQGPAAVIRRAEVRLRIEKNSVGGSRLGRESPDEPGVVVERVRDGSCRGEDDGHREKGGNTLPDESRPRPAGLRGNRARRDQSDERKDERAGAAVDGIKPHRRDQEDGRPERGEERGSESGLRAERERGEGERNEDAERFPSARKGTPEEERAPRRDERERPERVSEGHEAFLPVARHDRVRLPFDDEMDE